MREGRGIYADGNVAGSRLLISIKVNLADRCLELEVGRATRDRRRASG